MARWTILLLTLCALLQRTKAQYNDTAAFKIPANWAAGRNKNIRPVYQIGTTLDVRWDTTQEDYRIILTHIDNLTTWDWTRGATLYSKSKANTEEGGFAWNVDPQSFDLSVNVFFLLFQPIDGTAPANISAWSEYFNLTTEAVATASVSSTATVSATSLTSLPSLDSTPTTSSSATADAAAASTGGLSSGGVIGLGVGLGIACALLFGVAVFFWLRSRQRKRQAGPAAIISPGIYTDNTQQGWLGAEDAKSRMSTYVQQSHLQPTEMQTPLMRDTSSQVQHGGPHHMHEMPSDNSYGK